MRDEPIFFAARAFRVGWWPLPARSCTGAGTLRCLIQHFFFCFFAGESSQSVFRPVTYAVQMAAFLAVPPAILVMCLIPAYNGTMPWGQLRPAWLQAQDHFYLVTYSCTVAGVAAVLTWDRFLPTLLDARIFPLLPLSKRRLFAAKCLAMALFLATFIVCADLPATLMLTSIAGSPRPLRQLVAHAAAVLLAGYATAVGTQAALSAVLLLPGRLRRACAPILQGGLISAFLLMLFLSPRLVLFLQHMPGNWGLPYWLPPFWFTGLYEVVLAPERSNAAFHTLFVIAMCSLVVSTGGFWCAFPLVYRRQLTWLLEGTEQQTRPRRPMPAAWVWAMQRMLPQPAQRAAFWFIQQTMLRIPQLRTITIIALSTGIALALLTSVETQSMVSAPYFHLFLAWPASTVSVAIAFTLVGVLLCLSTNLAPRAVWIFEVAMDANGKGLTSGARRWTVLLLGILALSGLATLAPLEHRGLPTTGPLAAVSLSLAAVCVVLVELLMNNFHGAPFATQRLRQRGVLRGLAWQAVLLFVVLCFIRMTEHRTAHSLRFALFLICAAGLVHTSLHQRRASAPSRVEEEPDDDGFPRLRI